MCRAWAWRGRIRERARWVNVKGAVGQWRFEEGVVVVVVFRLWGERGVGVLDGLLPLGMGDDAWVGDVQGDERHRRKMESMLLNIVI